MNILRFGLVSATLIASATACSSGEPRTSPASSSEAGAPDAPWIEAGTADAPGPVEPDADRGASRAYRKTYPKDTVRKIERLASGALLFREPVGGDLIDVAVERSLAWVDDGGSVQREIRAGAHEVFVDAVTHPSGESTLFVRQSDARCALRRYSPEGALLATTLLDELDLETDPTEKHPEKMGPSWDVGACQSFAVLDSGRLAADGEAVYLVNRGGSNGTVLFRYAYESPLFRRVFRLPVAPRVAALAPTGIVASHRVLRTDNWSFVPRVVVDDEHRARVLLVFGFGLFREQYNEMAADPADGMAVLLTVTPDGKLTESRSIRGAMTQPSSDTDIEGIRYARNSVILTGRVLALPAQQDGFGWNAFFLQLADGEEAPRAAAVVNLDKGDAFSDVVPLGATDWLAAGRSGYWENPSGASISEEARSELVVLGSDGAVRQRLDIANGPRHNGAISLSSTSDPEWFHVGGIQNGAGSHSADADDTLLDADGWLELRRIPVK